MTHYLNSNYWCYITDVLRLEARCVEGVEDGDEDGFVRALVCKFKRRIESETEKFFYDEPRNGLLFPSFSILHVMCQVYYESCPFNYFMRTISDDEIWWGHFSVILDDGKKLYFTIVVQIRD